MSGWGAILAAVVGVLLYVGFRRADRSTISTTQAGLLFAALLCGTIIGFGFLGMLMSGEASFAELFSEEMSRRERKYLYLGTAAVAYWAAALVFFVRNWVVDSMRARVDGKRHRDQS